MQKQNDIGLNLLNLTEPKSYKEFDEGYFLHQPDMKGYYYIFRNITKPKICLILNLSNINYKTNEVKIKDYIYIVFNIKTIEEYFENFTTTYLPIILDIMDKNVNKKNTRNLPYGYYADEKGQIKIDITKANEVKKIYNRYKETQSVRDIAQEMDTNFSHIRDILHDNEEYMRMKEKILPMTKLKEINMLLAQNVKGTFKKVTTKEKIKDAQKRIKDKLKNLQ